LGSRSEITQNTRTSATKRFVYDVFYDVFMMCLMFYDVVCDLFYEFCDVFYDVPCVYEAYDVFYDVI